ncbi:MAG: TlpA family protein disulfide reductase [Candidatus Hydrogenedentes bacterium]|nr:TlpA family protein disulfide reductase [Candidatus Hydrogenedentota bacterium]
MERVLIGVIVVFAALITGAAFLAQPDAPETGSKVTAVPPDSASPPGPPPAAPPAPSPPPVAAEKPLNAAASPELPAIKTADADKIAALLKAAEGTVVVLNMWATWCPPCVAEMPELIRFYTAWNGKGVTFISLSADEYKTLESDIRPFQKLKSLPFPIHVLQDANFEKVEKSLKTPMSGAIPTTLIYDLKGKMVKMREGEVTQKELESWIAPYLK